MEEKYNILLVDDEELAIRGIEKGIYWDRLAVEKVFKAHSVETAKRIMANYRIHILLTDIDLVNDTGINLLRWVRQEQQEIECIFFTCHAEFGYVQEALRLGARDFLLKPVSYDKLEALIHQVIQGIKEQGRRRQQYSVMDEMLRESDRSRENQTIAEIKEYIMQNLAADIRREELANKVNFSVSYMGRLFREKEGMTISDYIMGQRINMAKHLLSVTELSITDIANRTGFDYHSYFTRCFKRETGMTPNQYRAEQRANDCGLEDV